MRFSSSQMIEKTTAHVRSLLSGEGSGHDWWHIYRVRSTALAIGREEGANLFVVELASLLHDIADWKFHDGDETAGPRAAAQWLEGLGAGDDVAAHVSEIVAGVTFKGAGVETPMPSLEGRVVQDADRLDALGAVGIARAFAYGGARGREMYNPDIKPENHLSFEEYKRNTGPTLNHFYEKLLLLKDRMNTEAGKRLARERHVYMEGFLEQFYREWR